MVASKVISTDKNIFKFGYKVTNIVSVDVILKSTSHNFWIYFYIPDFQWVRSLLKSFSVKFQVSTMHKTNKYVLVWRNRRNCTWNFLKVGVELYFEVPLSGCSRNTLTNKNMFKVDDNEELQWFQLMLRKWLCN